MIKKKTSVILLSVATGLFAVLLTAAIVGTYFGDLYQALINSYFSLKTFDVINNEDTDVDAVYWKSAFGDGDDFDEVAYNEYVTATALQTAEEGAVLLWNDNGALPLERESSVSLFGKSTYNYNYCVDGSGFVKVTDMQDMKASFEDAGFAVNKSLWAKYAAINPGLSWCTFVGEPSWQSVFTSEANLRQYGDNAVMILTRRGCEDTDMSVTGSEGLNGNILDLNPTEIDYLNRLAAYKKQGVFKKLIVLISSSHALQFSELAKYESDIDACMWVGMGGKTANQAIVNLLSGKAVPSGRLSNVYAYDNLSHPAMENFGDYRYANAADYKELYDYDKASNHKNPTSYLVYQEGIYVGYKYYETRYEDSVLGKGNAGSVAGARASSGGWNYGEEVIYPFGYGLSYTSFGYDDYKVSRKGDDYEISVKVTNSGDKYAGKEVVQVYLQRPYTEYDRTNGIEKPSVELAGFAKTDVLEPGKSETVKVTVKGEVLKTYDANNKKTYILEAGDYYLALGKDAHDAVNNILSAKGKGRSDGMDQEGDGAKAEKIKIDRDDYEKYAKSEETEKEISNLFDDGDINKYAGRGDNSVTYLSRSDWQATYPAAPTFRLNDKMVADLAFDKPFTENPKAEIPLYGEDHGLSLVMMRDEEIAYDNEYWDQLLDQMTFADQALLVCRASGSTQAVPSAGVPGTYDCDGPQGLTKFYSLDSFGSGMCYPCEVLMGSTFNSALIEEIGKCIGEDMLNAGYQVFYGPGANLHRAPFSGRNGEYYSEDTYLTGIMLASEVRGIMSKGGIPMFKHFVLNDQETNRHGVNIWCNEQTLREVYLEAFRGALCEENCHSVMSSFNRIGTTWTGAHRGLLTDFLRGEWGFEGYCETDGNDIDWMSYPDGIINGTDMYMKSGNPKDLEKYRNSPTFCAALREASHRIMYALSRSSAMNGLTSDSVIVRVINWWQYAIVTLDIVFGVLMMASAAGLILTLLLRKNGGPAKNGD